MAILEFLGAAILLIVIMGVAFWVGLREQGFLRNMSRRSRANAIAARERAEQYRAQQQYGPPPGYGQQPGYGPPPGYVPPPGYGQPPNPEGEQPRLPRVTGGGGLAAEA